MITPCIPIFQATSNDSKVSAGYISESAVIYPKDRLCKEAD